jgi:hypothetical protein
MGIQRSVSTVTVRKKVMSTVTMSPGAVASPDPDVN